MNWVLLRNSLVVSGLTTLFAVAFGVVTAVWLTGLSARVRRRWLGVAIAGLALPPFLVTNCWLHYLGFAGAWRAWLPLNILSLGGAVWILSLMLWPITLLFVWSAWQRLESPQLESDPMLSGWALIRYLLFPLGRARIVQAAFLTFVLALNNFAVPTILQVKVLPAEIWVQFNTTFNTARAVQLSWMLILAPLLLVVWFARREIGWPRVEGPVGWTSFRRQLGKGWFRLSGLCGVALLLLSAALPIFQLLSAKRTWVELPSALVAGRGALWNSLLFAGLSATAIMAMSGLARGRKQSKVRAVGAWLLWLPFLVPGVLLGIALITLLNRPWLPALYGSMWMVVLALVIRYFALGWSTVVHAKASADRDLVEAARLEGANGWQLWKYAYWPQIAPQLTTAWYVVFLLCLWDVESMVLVYPPGRETVALRVFNLLHYGYTPQVNALCLSLLVLAIAPLLIWRLIHGMRMGWQGRKEAGLNRTVWTLVIIAGGMLFSAGCGVETDRDRVSLHSQLFSSSQVIGTRGTGSGQFNKPRSVAVDTQDNLYVVDMTGRVQKFSPQGAFLLSWQMPETDSGKPKGMCRDVEGNVVVIEPHYQRINHFSPSGVLLSQWGSAGTNAGQFTLPRAVAINSAGEVYVSEYMGAERVQRFVLRKKADAGGGPVQFGGLFGEAGTGPGQFNRPEGLCVDGQGRVYVADSCNHRIQIFSGIGKLLRMYGKAGTGKGELSYPYDICVDSMGRQYVCEFGNSRIQVFNAKDEPIEIIGGHGLAAGQFNNPWGVALDSHGNLYVADSLNHRVQKLMSKEKPVSSGPVTQQPSGGQILSMAGKAK
jgi:ABC-type Fe3+ transport system permease subunit/DNA-binding beta-propeller fold protein YncE